MARVAFNTKLREACPWHGLADARQGQLDVHKRCFMPQFAAVMLSMLSWLYPGLPDSCPAASPVVAVHSALEGVVVDNSLDRAELADMAGKGPLSGFHLQGLTDVTYTTAPRFVTESLALAGGRWCAALKEVTVSFGLGGPASIHIAREIARPSCRYSSVLAHEMRHVSISEAAVASAVADLQAVLQAAIQTRAVVVADTKEAARELLTASFAEIISDVTKRHIQSAELQNAAIDTRRSYERLSSECADGQ